jgi:catechol 2,3-dioxygenase-like lactoylglutathione lyase family enzyme
LNVRYMVDDVEHAVDFYTAHFGFAVAGGAQPLVLGATFRNDIVSGPGGRQILLEDPSGTRSSSSSPPAPEHWAAALQLRLCKGAQHDAIRPEPPHQRPAA